MSLRKWVGVTVVWLVSLVATAVWAHAQRSDGLPLVPLPMPLVVSGGDIGFRVEARRGDIPVGRFVIRSSAGGQWTEPEIAVSTKRLSVN